MAGVRNIDHREESASVAVLEAQAAKYGELGKKITVHQSRIVEVGDNLKELMGPAYNDTQVLQTTSNSKSYPTILYIADLDSDIDKVLAALERARQMSQDKGEEEQIIRNGYDCSSLSAHLY